MHRIRIRPRPLVLLGSLLLLIPLGMAASEPAEASRAMPGRDALVLDEQFQKADWGTPGALWCPYSTAYPNGRTNPGNWKLDRLTPRALSVVPGRGLRLRAEPLRKTRSGPWATGLVTTEPWGGGRYGGSGFTLRPNDYVLVHMRLPDSSGGGGHGAWPGIWTWRGGGNEIDILEWHSETPDIAEFVNHVNGPASSFVHSPYLGYGKWVYIGARIGTDTVTWYLGDSSDAMKAVYSDNQGVPADWRAYLVINLSVSSQRGRPPARLTPITAEVSSVQVYR